MICAAGKGPSSPVKGAVLAGVILVSLLVVPVSVGELDGAGPPGFRDFIRSDCNVDGILNIADAIFLLNCLFIGGPCGPCDDACDANDDDANDIADAIFSLNFLFIGGPPPPPPFPLCGPDPTLPPVLTCVAYPPCGC